MKLYRFIYILIFYLICEGCGDKFPKNATLLKVSDSDMGWNDLFEYVGKLDLKYPKGFDPLIIHSYEVGCNDRGDIFVISAGNNSIMWFDSAGNFISFIGRKGEGPGEYKVPLSISIAINGDLFVYDLGGRKLIRYSFPEYEYSGEIKVPVPVIKSLMVSQDELLCYSLYGQDLLFKLNILNGEVKKIRIDCPDSLFKIFSARFPTGSICYSKSDTTIYFASPCDNIIYEVSFGGDIINRFIPSRSAKKFFPSPPKFPKGLSPYDMSDRHRKWYDSFDHLLDIFSLEGDLILIQYYKTDGWRNWHSFHFNIFKKNGDILAKSLQTPNKGSIIFTKGREVYEVVKGYIVNVDSIVPSTIYVYKLRNNALIRY
jgi:hypothetical protein